MIRRIVGQHFLYTLVTLTLGTSVALGQAHLGVPVGVEREPKKMEPAPGEGIISSAPVEIAGPSPFGITEWGGKSSGYLVGNRDFPNFIGFISNPIQSIDPRATTELWPMFGAGWVSSNNATLPSGKTLDRSILPSGDMQVYGAGLNVALSDRLSFGLNQGGYAVADFTSDRANILRKLGLPIPDRDIGGQRQGWLNLGGYFQYTLIADVPNQFLLTAGLRWEAPVGATQLFQGGANPAYLAPYLTIGKEFGDYHILATTGYEFPAGSGDATTNTFYLNLHFDRKIGWLYPLIELNGAYHTHNVDLTLTSPLHNVISLGTFSTTGNSLTTAVGANAVLVPGKFEIGAVYTRPVTAQDHFDFNGMLVKMVFRY